ncbi:unnamed protein product [Closterium sp. NIES-54]
MTPRKELLDDVRAAPINEVCSASGHALKVAGAGRAAFKGADGKPVVLHDVLLVPDLKANLISLRKQLYREMKFVEGIMYGGWKKQPETKASEQIEQITMQLDLTPSVWGEGEEAAAEGGDGEKVQEAPSGGGDDVETSGSTKGAAVSEGGELLQGKLRPGCTRMATLKLTVGADVAEQQLGNEEALLILPHGYDPDEEDEPAYCFLAPAPEGSWDGQERSASWVEPAHAFQVALAA